MTPPRAWASLGLFAVVTAFVVDTSPVYAKGKPASTGTKRIIDHWTAERRAVATPRDLVIDGRGQGYLRKANGSLQPYGHRFAARQLSAASPPAQRRGRPGGGGGGGDSDAPSISNMLPHEAETIASSHSFSAHVTDNSGVKSVSFEITYPNGVTTQTFSASNAGNDTWEINVQGFSDGSWSYRVIATDTAKKGGNTTTTNRVNFIVDSGSGSSGGSGSHVVTNSGWADGGAVQTAAGRIFFEMPDNPRRRKGWSGYVCSGTVATDGTSGRSVIITAAHCVYDDANKAFARNVLFIPDQQSTTASGTDTNCSNDPLGCWVPAFGVVDANWTTRTFPDNIAWDYAYYVVNDSGAHSGPAVSSEVLDEVAGSLEINFGMPSRDDGDPSPNSNDFTHALGYSYSDDPNFMYCAEDMTTEGAVNWWLPSCELSGGSSGGPWIQPMDIDNGSGPIISVNSWGYTDRSGMAGPLLEATSAECLFTIARTEHFDSAADTDGDAGVVVGCP